MRKAAAMFLMLAVVCPAVFPLRADEPKKTAEITADPGLKLIEDTGFGNPNNVGMGRLESIGGYLYVGTWNPRQGGILYRSRDLRHWSQINQPGFGNKNSFTIQYIIPFRDQLYVSCWNFKNGGALYRANVDVADGDITWQTITTNGMGDRGNQAFTHMHVYKGHLYGGCFNLLTGPEVWRSATGDPDSWEQVNQDSWGDPRNSDATMTFEHGGYLYMGTESARAYNRIGCQLLRTDGKLSPPYDQWEQVNPDGFGNPKNHNIYGLGMLRGKMYAATWNWTQGVEVWRATPEGELPFKDWEKVSENGFGNPDTITTTRMLVLDETIYIASLGKFTLQGSWFSPDAKLKSSNGAAFVKSSDGETWTQITKPGFMEFPMIGIMWMCIHEGKIYLAGHAVHRPCQLWEYDPRPARPEKAE
jgi:hypothetical protein